MKNEVDGFVTNLIVFIERKYWETGWWSESKEKWMYAPSLTEFICRPEPGGIRKSVAWVYANLEGPAKIDERAAKALSLFDAAIKAEGGNARLEFQRTINEMVEPIGEFGTNQHGSGDNNVISSFTSDIQGNSASYTLARLKRDNPALAQRVVVGELSAHAAAIEAGFRKRVIQIPDDLDAAIKKIEHHFNVKVIIQNRSTTND
jgi:hypothetical protein